MDKVAVVVVKISNVEYDQVDAVLPNEYSTVKDTILVPLRLVFSVPELKH